MLAVRACKRFSEKQAAVLNRNNGLRPFLLWAFPAWPYSTGWGYYPSGGLGLILLIVLILILMGVI